MRALGSCCDLGARLVRAPPLEVRRACNAKTRRRQVPGTWRCGRTSRRSTAATRSQVRSRSRGRGGVSPAFPSPRLPAPLPPTADVSVADFAEAALFFGADAVVLTGSSTGARQRSAAGVLQPRPTPGKPTSPADVDAVRDAVGEQLRIYIGSGVTPSNAHLFARADGVIVGSYVKEGGRWAASVCDARSREVVAAIEAAC